MPTALEKVLQMKIVPVVKSALIAAGQFDKITSLTREAVNLVQNM
jgi:hypothetical protein